jgi:hypothetical protein
MNGRISPMKTTLRPASELVRFWNQQLMKLINGRTYLWSIRFGPSIKYLERDRSENASTITNELATFSCYRRRAVSQILKGDDT